jgi:hypothetical protein
MCITSNDGALQSASAVLEVTATNPEYNQPVLRIKQAGKRGGAAAIRIDDPNPDIEFVETGLTGPDPNAGKFEIAVQADQLQINARKADVVPNKGFIVIVNASVAEAESRYRWRRDFVRRKRCPKVSRFARTRHSYRAGLGGNGRWVTKQVQILPRD